MIGIYVTGGLYDRDNLYPDSNQPKEITMEQTTSETTCPWTSADECSTAAERAGGEPVACDQHDVFAHYCGACGLGYDGEHVCDLAPSSVVVSYNDEIKAGPMTPNEAFAHVFMAQGQSVDYALTHGGWSIRPAVCDHPTYEGCVVCVPDWNRDDHGPGCDGPLNCTCPLHA